MRADSGVMLVAGVAAPALENDVIGNGLVYIGKNPDNEDVAG